MEMKGKNLLYVDVHVLQTVPPSCVNRDDTGSPKTAIYGGAVRARVSSQCWKRAMRTMFKEIYPREKLGERTLMAVKLIADEIRKLGDLDDPEKAAADILNSAGIKTKAKDRKTGALFFISYAQAKALAQLAIDESKEESKEVELKTKEAKAKIKAVEAKAKAALKEYPGIDVALFGRMVADDPSLNTDASAQVAHSISTHRVANEFDYFTAVDDLSPEDTAGAGHIGTVEFNSSTLYRYGTVAVHDLHKQLGMDASSAVREFVRSFVTSMPTGKQNTFANRTLPDAVLVTLRTDQPINFVGAYESPIPANDEGYIRTSASRLVEHANRMYHDFASEPAMTLVTGDLLSGLGSPQSFTDLLDALEGEIGKHFSELGVQP